MDIRAFFVALAAVAVGACSRSGPPLTGTAATADGPRAAVAQACVSFSAPGAGTSFGAWTTTPSGSVAWTENGIPVSVESFRQGSGDDVYNVMRTEYPPAGFALSGGTTGRANNVNAGFDFGRLPFVVRSVRFNFLHQGGVENLSVNGSPVFVGDLTAAPASLGGVAVRAEWEAVRGGSQGTVTLSGGAIGNVMVGGEELWLDNVCAYA
jgi:hypothetical protein